LISQNFGKKLLFIILIVVAVSGITFTVWYFFVEAVKNTEIKTTVLPANCYSINGQQICPKK